MRLRSLLVALAIGCQPAAAAYLEIPPMSGDVTTSAGSSVATIAPGAVTSSKMATGAAAGNLGYTPYNGLGPVITLSDPPYNVRCDGVTDWSATINSAVTAARTAGAALAIGQQPNTLDCLLGGAADVALNSVTLFSRSGAHLKAATGAKRIVELTGYRPSLIGFQIDDSGAEVSQTTLAGGVTGSVASAAISAGGGGSGCALLSTFTMSPTTGGGTQTQVSVTTNGAGVVTAINSISVAGAYTALPTANQRSADDPVLRSTPVSGGTCSGVLLDLTLATTTSISVASASNGPGFLIGQRINIWTTNGNVASSWVQNVSGTTVTVDAVYIPPAASGQNVYASFGAVYVTNSQYATVTDNVFNAVWGGVLIDDGMASGAYAGNSLGATARNTSSGARMFGEIKGRNSHNNNSYNNHWSGGWNQTTAATGDGATTAFALPAPIFLKRELTVEINSVVQTNPTNYTLSTNGLTVNFVTAPASGAALSFAGYYYGADGIVDDCHDVTSAGCGGNHYYARDEALGFHRPFYASQSSNFTLDNVGFDSCSNSCLTLDGVTGGNNGANVGLYWGPVQVATFNSSQATINGFSALVTSGYPASGAAGVIEQYGLDTNAAYQFDTLYAASYSNHGGGVCIGICASGAPFASDLIVQGATGAASVLNGAVTAVGYVNGATNAFSFLGRAQFRSPADNVALFEGNSGSGFNRIELGGTTSSYPALALSGTGLLAELADASANTTMTALNHISTGAASSVSSNQISYGGTTVAPGTATCPSGAIGGQTVRACEVHNVAGVTEYVPTF